MKQTLQKILIKCKPIIIVFDFLLSPITLLATIWVKQTRKGIKILGLDGLPVTEKISMKLGVYPVLDHYYEPLINPKKYLNDSLKKNRKLPGINFGRDEDQLLLLSKFHYNHELTSFPKDKSKNLEYYYNNPMFGAGDSEYLYNMVRHFKPGKIIEIGSGNSTLMVRNALKNNQKDDPNYHCDHICIEPYERLWLEQIGIKIIRQKVEDVDPSIFTSLGQNDILFIDSSHMIRPQGDVLCEFLQVLPILNSGVIIHIHDIFTPNDYDDDFLNNHFFFNEQYLLEAFLCFNDQFKIIGAVNYLYVNYNAQLLDKCPVLAGQGDKGWLPKSYWLRRI